LSEVF